MKVKAKGSPDRWVGYYGLFRRRGGDVFTLTDDKHFTSSWMQKVEVSVPESKPASRKKFSAKTEDDSVPDANPEAGNQTPDSPASVI